MIELVNLLKKLPKGSDNVINNLKFILLKKYPLLRSVKLTSRNFKIIYLGDIQERQKEFWREIHEANEENRENYEKNKIRTPPFPEIMLKEFYDYWSEPDRFHKKLKFEDQKYWSLKGRLATWYRKSKYSR
jgi:hypothetical protein